MIQRVKNHVMLIPRRANLLIIYGLIMFASGMGLNHFLSDDSNPASGKVEIQQDIYNNNLSSLEEDALKYSDLNDHQKSDAINKSIERELAELGVENIGEDDNASAAPEEIREKEETLQSEYIYDTTVKSGDAFTRILTKSGVGKKEAYLISETLNKVYTLRNIKVGQKISIVFKEKPLKGKNIEAEFVSVRIEKKDRIVELIKLRDGKYQAKEIPKILHKKLSAAKGAVKNSLYVSATALGVPQGILQEFIRAYSFDVDFQRDIRKGHKFEFLYEEIFNDDGQKVRDGELLLASLTVGGDNLRIYRYSPSGNADKGDNDYYTKDGRSLRRSLLKTPINGAIISSPFGKRTHPISKFTRMHKGIDFAAPRGTPIYAGGDGKISFIGRNGGYGNYIRIKHSNDYSTAYAHISKFAKGMKKWKRVKQGQIIAYVGTTGASTGPHLHYEILKRGKQVNPIKVNLPKSKRIKGKSLKKFTKVRENLERIYKKNL